MKLSPRNILICLSAFAGSMLYAQPAVTVNARVNKNYILIGEPVELRLEASFRNGRRIRFFEIDTLSHFEMLNKGRVDTVRENDQTRLSQVITITSFDSGRWKLPALRMPGYRTSTDTIGIMVNHTPYDPSAPYHDIHDIIEPEPERFSPKTPWYLIAILLLVAGFIVYRLLTRKRESPAATRVETIDHFRYAEEALKRLKEEGGNLDPRIFYSRLTDIFRQYLHNRTGIHSMHQTTGRLIVMLSSLQLETEIFQRLAQTLRLSDSVKFARYQPDENEKDESIKHISDAISVIEKKQSGNDL